MKLGIFPRYTSHWGVSCLRPFSTLDFMMLRSGVVKWSPEALLFLVRFRTRQIAQFYSTRSRIHINWYLSMYVHTFRSVIHVICITMDGSESPSPWRWGLSFNKHYRAVEYPMKFAPVDPRSPIGSRSLALTNRDKLPTYTGIIVVSVLQSPDFLEI